MVKIQIDVDEKVLKEIEIYKAHNRLKSKALAVEKILTKELVGTENEEEDKQE